MSETVTQHGPNDKRRKPVLPDPSTLGYNHVMKTHPWIALPLSFILMVLASGQQSNNKPNPLAPIADELGLPRVLLIGDSISIGYTLDVRANLEGIANVHRPATNCGPTLRGLMHLDKWLGDKPWDVIHFNWGLHDLKYIQKDSEPRHNGKLTTVNEGEQMVPIDDYAANLQVLVNKLQSTGAALIWRNTTPVPEGAKGRVVGDSDRYNDRALKIMRQHSIPVDDLYAFAKERAESIQREADVHYTPQGSKQLADQVTRGIMEALPLNTKISVQAKASVGLGQEAQAKLPDPLLGPDGTCITDPHDWPQQQAYLKGLLAHFEYGHAPAPVTQISFQTIREDYLALDGKATKREVRVRFGPVGTPSFDLLLYVPNDRTGPAPVFLGLNFHGNHTIINDPEVTITSSWVPGRGAGVVDNRAIQASRGTSASRWPIAAIIDRGYAVATVYHGDIDPDFNQPTNGIQRHLAGDIDADNIPHQWGSLRAWAYGLSRAADYLQQDANIDPDRIAVMGHSRNGKTALVAGAFDPRFSLVISNQSGCGGAALSVRRHGETIKVINTNFPHWFCGAHKAFNDREDHQPIDQHTLIATLAPRPVLICSATGDDWADPVGEYLSAKLASKVYQWLGKEGMHPLDMPGENQLIDSVVGYHVRPGRHGIGIKDWTVFMNFADKHWQ